ncbi:hypothetical protein [Chitinophaga sp.]|uniref:hypothetical protein n=1 Tax=Chitinophaga sp. TaxID=1869181 RepID=UPI002F95F179
MRITEHGERFSWLFNSVIVLGILVAPWANMLSSVLAIVLLLLRKVSWAELPGYLLILNLSILLVQILV